MSFQLGRLVITRNALSFCEGQGIDALALVVRHAHRDWGDLGAEDKRLNDEALESGDRLFSAYDVQGARFFVITEWDRSVTTIMLAEDY